MLPAALPHRRIRRLPPLLLLLLPLLLPAQDRVTEKSVDLEKRFIEAKRQALIGKTEEAIARFGELAEEVPDDTAILFELARLHHANERPEAAIDALRRAYRLRPDPTYALFLGELYRATGQYRPAAELYAELRKRDPADAALYLTQAEFLVLARDPKAALAVYDDLEKRTGVTEETARARHNIHLADGDQRRAERALAELVNAFPERTAYRHLLAAYYLDQDDTPNARAAYEALLAREPNDVRAQLALQQLGGDAGPASAAGGDDEAATLAMLARPEVDIDLKIGKLLPLVQAAAAGAREPEAGERALRLTTELRRIHPDEAKASALQGDVLFNLGRYAAAADAYRATVELDDTVYPVWEQLLTTLYLSNEIGELRRFAEEALDVFPNRPAIYVHYALGEAFRYDFAEAESLLQQAQLMTSADPAARGRLNNLQAALQQLELGKATGERVDPAQLPGGAAAPLARLLAARLGPPPPLAELTALDGPDNTNPLLLELLGDAQLRAGDRAAAADSYARARAAGSKSAALARKSAAARNG